MPTTDWTEQLIRWVSRFWGAIFLWHGVRHFGSYPLLGSQSALTHPVGEWLILGLLLLTTGLGLILRPGVAMWLAAAVVDFRWYCSYPLCRSIAEPTWVACLLAMVVLRLGGRDWVPFACLPSVVGFALAGSWKWSGGIFSITDLTNVGVARYGWMDAMNLWLLAHPSICHVLSQGVIWTELSAPVIWTLFFYPKLYRLRACLGLAPIALTLGINATANVDEFPWLMMLNWAFVLLPWSPSSSRPKNRAWLWVGAVVLGCLLVSGIISNVQRIASSNDMYTYEEKWGLLPDNRYPLLAMMVVTPYWSVYDKPVSDQYYGGTVISRKEILGRLEQGQGCGWQMNRWERRYWNRLGLAQAYAPQEVAAVLARYSSLAGATCTVERYDTPVKGP